MTSPPNLAWGDVEIGKLLTKEFGCPTAVINDVDSGMYGEYRFGAAKDAFCALGVFPGTGIGGGCVYRGEILRGHNITAMEIGHCQVVYNGPLCGCGQRGCLESVASRTAIAANAARAALRGDAPHLFEKAGTDLANIRSGALAESIKEGDKAVEVIVEEAARLIGLAVSTTINLLGGRRRRPWRRAGRSDERPVRDERRQVGAEARDAGVQERVQSRRRGAGRRRDGDGSCGLGAACAGVGQALPDANQAFAHSQSGRAPFDCPTWNAVLEPIAAALQIVSFAARQGELPRRPVSSSARDSIARVNRRIPDTAGTTGMRHPTDSGVDFGASVDTRIVVEVRLPSRRTPERRCLANSVTFRQFPANRDATSIRRELTAVQPVDAAEDLASLAESLSDATAGLFRVR